MAIWIKRKGAKGAFNNTFLGIVERIGKEDELDRLVRSNRSIISIEGPFIDFISVIYSPQGFDHKQYLVNYLNNISSKDSTDKTATFKALGSMEGYITFSTRIGKSTFFVQVSTKHVRFKWNPFKAGIEGHKQISELIFAMLCDGSSNPYIDFLNEAKINTIDVAFDFGNCAIERIAANAPMKSKRELHLKSGQIQTIYLGSRKNDKPRIKVYDKLAQLKEITKKQLKKEAASSQANKDLLHYYVERYENVTRIEYTCKPDCAFTAITESDFELEKLDLYHRDTFMLEFLNTDLEDMARCVWEMVVYRKPGSPRWRISNAKRRKCFEKAIQRSMLKGTSEIQKTSQGVTISKKKSMWRPVDLFQGDFQHHVLTPLSDIVSDLISNTDSESQAKETDELP